MKEKFERLKDDISNLKRAAVAFSGGVDSTFLLKVAHDVLGERCVAVTAKSILFPEREHDEAREFCEKEGIAQYIIEQDALSVEGFAENPLNRCYICKSALFKKMRALADGLGTEHILEGSNLDDEGDYRPGLIAVKEQGIKSPLREAGLYKDEIRALSKELGLPTWDKPSFACLASRFVYGETIDEKKLEMVGRAEQRLLDLGLRQLRVRIHGDMARIEALPEDFGRIIQNAEDINSFLKNLGFSYVSLDLGGYRTGSMNKLDA